MVYRISHRNKFPSHPVLLELAVSALGWPLMRAPTHHLFLRKGVGGSEDQGTSE